VINQMAGRWLYPFRLMDTKRGHMERVDIFHELTGQLAVP